MRFVQATVLMIGAAMYVFVFYYVSQDINGPNDLWALAIMIGSWNLLMLVSTIVAIVDSVKRLRSRTPARLAVNALVVKLASIPFFLLNFAALAFTFNASIVLIFIGPVLWAVIAIGVCLTYLSLLSTSVYALAATMQLRRERKISNGLTVLYTILSFLFVTDIAAAVMLFGHSRRRPRLALVWILTGTGIAMILLGVLDYHFLFLEGIFALLSSSNFGWLEWAGPIAIGIGVILATAIVSVVRRSALRSEAGQVTLVIETSTEVRQTA